MNLQKLDKFSLANIIANVINFHIAKHNLFESSFIKVINIINEYKQNNKNEKYHQNLEEYMKLVLETLDDENFEKYTEFSYLISMPKFHLLPEKIKNKALQHCHEHFKKFGYD